jgi:two-component system sensor histidine kinase QseC
MQRIYPCLWFDGQAEAAMNFYLGIFPDAKVTDVMRWGDVGPGPKGAVLACSFELDGQSFMVLNGGPQHRITPAISLVVDCETQAEVDHYWDRLLEGGGRTMACGWLTDRYGVSWQITPKMLPRLLSGPDAAKANRVMAAMMQMIKLDIAALQKAADANA